MLGVGIIQIHYLNDGRIATLLADKVVVIEIPVPFIHGNSRQLIQPIRPLRLEIHLIDRFRNDPSLKGCQRRRIVNLSHPVMVADQ